MTATRKSVGTRYAALVVKQSKNLIMDRKGQEFGRLQKECNCIL